MLKIGNEKNKAVFDGDVVDFGAVNPQKLLLASLTIPIEFEKDLMVGPLVEKLEHIKTFAEDCFSDSLDVLSILVDNGITIKKYSKVRLYKIAEKDEDGYVFFVNRAEFIESEDGTNLLRNVFVEIDENIRDEKYAPVLKEESKMNYTLFDVLSVLFEEILEDLQNGGLLI